MKKKTKFVCKVCGSETYKFGGKCFSCGEFNSLEEESYFIGQEKQTKSSKTIKKTNKKAVSLNEVEEGVIEKGFSSNISELDRVLGGHIVEGSLVLIGGSPGNGKSTLLSKASDNVASSHKVLYASGEESVHQIKKRMTRLNIESKENLKLLYSRDIDEIEEAALEIKPKLMILDSINAIGDSNISGDPGDIAQIKHCINRLLTLAKENGITIFIISQVTKDNEIAGPKKLEHYVDTTLFLEGEKYSDLRLLRVLKNRFGSNQEIGVFRMVDEGLIEVPNPSEYLLENRPKNASGSGVICISDSRPLLIEVQALVSPPVFQNAFPSRTSEGFPHNRLKILTAVLERKCGARELSAKDIYINVVGGIAVKEPGADLGIAMTIYSSNTNKIIDQDIVLIGEVGLAGEVRPVSKIEQLIKEAERVGFTKAIIPRGSLSQLSNHSLKIDLTPVSDLNECIKLLFK
ncbi:DNA repair protein RadA [Bacillus cereus]|uniref:DNA repair protein RadA n=1 Tax=Bacillus cereus TaxID=1396 RepID=UPI000B4A9FFB|nr:DNA repair protein RadA [Bacillus cereus]